MDNDTDKPMNCHKCHGHKFMVLFRKDSRSEHYEEIVYKCTGCQNETTTHREFDHIVQTAGP